MTTGKPIQPMRLTQFQLNKPMGGGASIEFVHSGKTCVYVEVFAPDSMTVAASLTDLSVDPPIPAPNDPLPAGFTVLPLIDASQSIYGGPVEVPTGHACASGIPFVPNLLATALRKDSGGLWEQTKRQAVFAGVCQSTSITVPGYACPWFAFTNQFPTPPTTGPEGESLPHHEPVSIPIPDHVSSVSVSASGDWFHAIGANSGPEGYGNPQPMVNPGYRSPTYNGQNIIPPATDPKVNTLVALLEPGVGNTSQMVVIGEAGQGANPPYVFNGLDSGDNRAIAFGMWDGRQWNEGISNGGDVTVVLQWTPEA